MCILYFPHRQVLKLHTKLGKPIPSTDPVVIAASTSSITATATAKTTSATSTAAKTASTTTTVKKVLATPKITFVGKTMLDERAV